MEIGEKLSGRYLLKDFIGQGGMANVYLATDLILDRDVAVKVLRFDFQDNADAIRRFQREAMSASQLLHHNIVEIYDVEQEGEQQYIVMEYVKGTDLKTFIRENAPLSLQTVVAIMSQILSAIEEAHKNQIIHRDIKPQNILITDDGQVKITDFGIAIALSDTSITQTNTLLGSVHYLSPEQARGSGATVKSDIYALGVVLYELITGTVPFDGESAVSVALKHFQEEFPRIKEKMEYVPQSLENVVLKATAKDLNSRYESVAMMLVDLSTCLSASRITEPMFVPNKVALHTTSKHKPLIHQKTQPVSLGAPEPLDENLLSYDTVAPINKPKRRRGWIGWLLLLITLGIAAYFVINSNIFQTVSMPNVINQTKEEAIKAIENVGLKVSETIEIQDDRFSLNQVTATDPKAGTKLTKGSGISITVNTGKEQVEIKDYHGKDYDTIRSELSALGFIVDRKDFAASSEEQGKILAQSVEPGTRVVPSETAITFTVGKVAENIVMQDFYNLPESMVNTFAEANGLTVNVEYAYNDYVPKGRVLSQEPSSNTALYMGDVISVVISEGPKEVGILVQEISLDIEYVPTYAETDVNKLYPLANKIQVFIGDSKNSINQLYNEFEITESDTIKLTLYIQEDGIGQYRVLRDGKVIYENAAVYPY